MFNKPFKFDGELLAGRSDVDKRGLITNSFYCQSYPDGRRRWRSRSGLEYRKINAFRLIKSRTNLRISRVGKSECVVDSPSFGNDPSVLVDGATPLK